MQKIASAVIIAAITLVALVFGIAALSTITNEAVDGTAYESTFNIVQSISNGALPVLLVVVILIVVAALVLALRQMMSQGRGKKRGRWGY